MRSDASCLIIFLKINKKKVFADYFVAHNGGIGLSFMYIYIYICENIIQMYIYSFYLLMIPSLLYRRNKGLFPIHFFAWDDTRLPLFLYAT